jgi:hypothetical protein
MIRHAPQIIMLSLMAFSVGVSASRYGQRKTDSYDMGDVFFGPAISLLILYWGGFFG